MNPLLTTIKIEDMKVDETFLIYGAPGSGKTVLASTFPKTKEKPMLIIDVMERGTGSIDYSERDNIEIVNISNYQEFEDVISDLLNGFIIDKKTQQRKLLKYSTIVIDTVTGLEYLIKEHLKTADGNRNRMTLQLWGWAREDQDFFYNMMKEIHTKTGAIIVAIAHEKDLTDESNPDFNRKIAALMTNAARSLAAKVSFVWYTKVEYETKVNKDKSVVNEVVYNTFIDRHPFLDTKCRKPVSLKIPQKVENLSYPQFKRNVLDKINARPENPPVQKGV